MSTDDEDGEPKKKARRRKNTTNVFKSILSKAKSDAFQMGKMRIQTNCKHIVATLMEQFGISPSGLLDQD